MDVTIIIVTFNSAHILKDAINTLPNAVKVIVVDNNSQDKSAEIAQQCGAEVIILPKNIGFGRANNAGLNKVQTNYALLLNPDAQIMPEALAIALEIMAQNAEIAILGAGNKGELTDVSLVAGACMFLNMQHLKKMGFFDEKIFLYHEDKELCWRAKKNNFRVCSSNQIQYFHKGDNSSLMDNDVTRLKYRLQGQSQAYFLRKSMGYFLGTINIVWKAFFGIFALPFFKKSLFRRWRGIGMLEFLMFGEKHLFNNAFVR